MGDKGYRGGKRAASLRGSGYYGNDEAGNKRYVGGSGKPTKREFVGSQSREYTFSDNVHGTRTITARSYWEAVRIAQSLGYKASDYKKRRSRGRK